MVSFERRKAEMKKAKFKQPVARDPNAQAMWGRTRSQRFADRRYKRPRYGYDMGE